MNIPIIHFFFFLNINQQLHLHGKRGKSRASKDVIHGVTYTYSTQTLFDPESEYNLIESPRIMNINKAMKKKNQLPNLNRTNQNPCYQYMHIFQR